MTRSFHTGAKQILDNLKRILDNDKSVWEQVYPSLTRYWKHRINREYPKADSLLVEDLVHDLYVKLLRDERRVLRQFEGMTERTVTAYLKRMARNLCIDHMRSSTNEQALTEEKYLSKDLPSPTDWTESRFATSPGEVLDLGIHREREEALGSLLAKLRTSQKLVVDLKLAGDTEKVISRKLDMPENTVASHFARARRIMRKEAEKSFPELMIPPREQSDALGYV